MATTWQPIATTTLSSESAITFSSIPNTYTDLIIQGWVRGPGSTAGDDFRITFNNDTSGLCSATRLWADGASTFADRETNAGAVAGGWLVPGNALANTFAPIMITFHNYANTNIFKSFVSRFGSDRSGAGRVGVVTGIYRSTNAINSIKVDYGGVNFAVGTTLTLYGIAAVV